MQARGRRAAGAGGGGVRGGRPAAAAAAAAAAGAASTRSSQQRLPPLNRLPACLRPLPPASLQFQAVEKLEALGINKGDIKKAKDASYHTCESLLMQPRKVGAWAGRPALAAAAQG